MGGNDLLSGLIGLASGGLGKAGIDWLRGRRKEHGDEQRDVADVAQKYWQRIDALEARVSELATQNWELMRQLAQRDVQIDTLTTKVAHLEERLNCETAIVTAKA